ncbi:MAG: Holliday junction resolvase RuvX [Clostridiales bacterium]|nr:Holliday junction resolvase RuvX [Clostridiales bacterium]
MISRILGLDVGEKRIGVAVSDPLGLTAQGVETIFTKGIERDVARVVELCSAYETNRVVAGLPRLLNGQEGHQASQVRRFCGELELRGLKVELFDERLTSVSAEKLLVESGMRREDRKSVIDKLAATYILQAYLDRANLEAKRKTTFSIDSEVFRIMEDLNMEQDDVVVLLDENDNECRFVHLMTLDYEGNSYVVLAPAEEMEDIAQDEAVVLRIDTDADGNDVYASIEDEDELEKVFERYLEIAGEDEE